jgi:protein-disulfide isomerase
VLDQFPNDVNYVVKHFPLPNHQFAHQSAMAALAAGKQGKFWEFHRQLLENHSRLKEEKIIEIATELELDMAQFSQDRNLESSRQLIQDDIANGKAVGVSGTPSLFLNGKRIPNKTLGSLPALIKRELEKP